MRAIEHLRRPQQNKHVRSTQMGHLTGQQPVETSQREISLQDYMYGTRCREKKAIAEKTNDAKGKGEEEISTAVARTSSGGVVVVHQAPLDKRLQRYPEKERGRKEREKTVLSLSLSSAVVHESPKPVNNN